MGKTKSYRKGSIAVMPTAQVTDLKTDVLRALEDDRYEWRTIPGLARALGISGKDVVRAIKSMPDQIVRTVADDGRALFTTRNHYERTHGFGDKLLSALADKVVA
jgi:hypothetical protein